MRWSLTNQPIDWLWQADVFSCDVIAHYFICFHLSYSFWSSINFFPYPNYFFSLSFSFPIKDIFNYIPGAIDTQQGICFSPWIVSLHGTLAVYKTARCHSWCLPNHSSRICVIHGWRANTRSTWNSRPVFQQPSHKSQGSEPCAVYCHAGTAAAVDCEHSMELVGWLTPWASLLLLRGIVFFLFHRMIHCRQRCLCSDCKLI